MWKGGGLNELISVFLEICIEYVGDIVVDGGQLCLEADIVGEVGCLCLQTEYCLFEEDLAED